MFRKLLAFAVLVVLAAVSSGCAQITGVGGCPDEQIEKTERARAAVESSLPPGAVAEYVLNDCDSGDPPFSTLYIRGSEDPVNAIFKKGGWKRLPDSTQPPGKGIEKPFEGGKLTVASAPYSYEAGDDPVASGVTWYVEVYTQTSDGPLASSTP